MTEKKSQRVTKYDLAALSLHVKDLINQEAACLEGREMHEGDPVEITIRTTIVKTEAGHLIFGNYVGHCQHG